MARTPTGKEALDKARMDLVSATSLDQFRIAQAVVLPLDFGLSLHETARAIGKNAGWVTRARLGYIKRFTSTKPIRKRGGRRNSLLSREDERNWVDRVRKAKYPWQSEAALLHEALEKVLQRPVGLSTVYRIIKRVDEERAPKTRLLTLLDPKI